MEIICCMLLALLYALDKQVFSPSLNLKCDKLQACIKLVMLLHQPRLTE